MSHIEGEIVINRPVEDVFDLIADERNEPRFNPNMVEVEQLTPGSVGVGTQFHAVTESMGRPTEMTIEYTRYERPRLLESTTHMSSMDIHGTLTFEAMADGTRMHWSWDVTPRGFYRLMEPVIARLGNTQEKKIWTGLKQYMESQGTPQSLS